MFTRWCHCLDVCVGIVSDPPSLLLPILPPYSRSTLSRNPSTSTHSSYLRCLKVCSYFMCRCPSWHCTGLHAQYKHTIHTHDDIQSLRHLFAPVLPGTVQTWSVSMACADVLPGTVHACFHTSNTNTKTITTLIFGTCMSFHFLASYTVKSHAKVRKCFPHPC